MKKILLICLLLFVQYTLCAQVVFSEVPKNNQLYGRDLVTNSSEITIEGAANNSSVNYDEIRIEVLEDGLAYYSETKSLTYDGSGIANFSFTFQIDAKLVNYDLNVYGLTSSVSTLEYAANDFVSGDVYIIQGQSNAVAKMYAGSSNINQSNFIRVFERGTVDTSRNQWFIAQGDGDNGFNGNAGQWGLKLAKLLVDTYQIPVAIFNGAKGGRPIGFFQAPNDYQTSVSSNYGKLYYRLNYTNLKDKVRAVFWSQGENTGGLSNLNDYKNEFLTLRSSWLNDYPNIEKFYIFQTRIGCGVTPVSFKLSQEPQRVLAVENNDIEIMSTLSLAQSGGCHFEYSNGYEEFATRIFKLVKRDLFNEVSPADIDPPMPISAYLSASNEVTIETSSSSLSMVSSPSEFALSNADGALINSITIDDNKILLTLSKNPGASPTISYSGPLENVTGNFITNTQGIELLSFYDFAIDTSVLDTEEISKKNDFLLKKNELNQIEINTKKSINAIKVYDTLGQLLHYESNIDNEGVILENSGLTSNKVLIFQITFYDKSYLTKKCFIY